MTDPLLLLPGTLCTSRVWDRALNGMDGPGVVHHVPDAVSIHEDVAQVLAAAPPRFSLAGLSFGGVVAMAVALAAPDRVRRLAVLATHARAPRADQLSGWSQARRRLGEGASPVQEQQRLLRLLAPSSPHEDGHDREPTAGWASTALAMAADTPADVLDRQLRAQATRSDLRPRLSAIACPTVVVAALGDQLCPAALHHEIGACIPGAEVVEVADCGHLSPLQRPADVAAALTRWLRR